MLRRQAVSATKNGVAPRISARMCCFAVVMLGAALPRRRGIEA